MSCAFLMYNVLTWIYLIHKPQLFRVMLLYIYVFVQPFTDGNNPFPQIWGCLRRSLCLWTLLIHFSSWTTHALVSWSVLFDFWTRVIDFLNWFVLKGGLFNAFFLFLQQVLSLHETLTAYGSVYYIGTIIPVVVILLGNVIKTKPVRSKARKEQW